MRSRRFPWVSAELKRRMFLRVSGVVEGVEFSRGVYDDLG